jgi:hypothetical protein
MSDLPFDPETDNAWEAMTKLANVDQMKRGADVIDIWFKMVARDTTPGSSDRALLRERAKSLNIVGNTPVLDQGLAVADFRLQHEQVFLDLESYCDPVTRPVDAPTDRLSVLNTLLPVTKVMVELRKKRGATKTEKDLAAGLYDWLERQLKAGITHPDGIAKEVSRVRAVIVEALDHAEFGKPADDPAEQAKRLAEREQRLAELREQAKDVLAHPDPLALIEAELPHIGYGGDPAAVLIGLLAMTTRILNVTDVPGSAVGHLQYEGASSAGKTFIVNTARRFLPPEAWREVGGSTKSLIYMEGSFAHCVLFFPELDAIPRGNGTDDQNVVASAVRGLLSEHRLKYQVTVRRPEDEGGGFVTQQIDLAGPTTMITTGLGKLEKQYATRCFTCKVNVDAGELTAKLRKAGQNEAHRNTREPLAGLIAHQAMLQLEAPYNVWIPFADQIANHAAKSAESRTLGPRVLRDINKIFAFIKAMCAINHAHRTKDVAGRWIAEPADYARVYQLVGPMYQEAESGVTARTRQVVETVKRLCDQYKETQKQDPAMPLRWGPSAKAVAEALNLGQNAVSEPVRLALAAGWLSDLEAETGLPRPSRRPFKLIPGDDPLPPVGGLMPPWELSYPASGVIAISSTKSAGTAEGSTITPPKPGSGGSVIAKGQESQAEMGTITQSPHLGGNGHRPVRTPIRLPAEP